MKLYFKNFEIYHNISIYSQLPPIQYFPGAAAEPLGSARGAQVRNLCSRQSASEGRKVVSPMHRQPLHQEISLVLIYVRG